MNINPRFAGTWLLESYELRTRDGTTSLPLGADPIGLFSFDPSGHFAVQLGPRNHDGAGYLAFFGTWTATDGDSGLARLQVIAGSAPNRVNGEQHRNFLFIERDLLRMRPPQAPDGSQATILWRRAPAT